MKRILTRIFRRKPRNLPVLTDLPQGGRAYVWPQDLRYRGEVWAKAGSLFYTQGDNHPIKRVRL